MGFTYNGVVVNEDNFREIYKGYPRDVRDEIELAVRHNANIGGYVKDCGSNFDKLREIRKAVEDGIESVYLSAVISPKTTYIIRKGICKGRNMSSLLSYYTRQICRISSSLLERLAEAVYNGVDITGIDFCKLPEELFDSVIHGLSKGYPMQFIAESKIHMTPSYVNVLMKGLALQLDITPFVTQEWEEDVMMFIFSHSKNIDITAFLSHISPRFYLDHVQCLIEGMRNGIGDEGMRKLCKKDDRGYPLYNFYQIDILVDALLRGYPYNDIFNITMSDVEMRDRLLQWGKNKVSLGKKCED